MRPHKRRTDRTSGIHRLLLGLAGLFLLASVLRTVPLAPIAYAQQAVQTFLTGEVSFEQAVQAIGSFAQSDEVRAVISDLFPQSHSFTPIAESSAPTQTLAATAAGVFPNYADDMIYPLILPCRIPVKNAVLTSNFGDRIHPLSQDTQFHKGIDLAAPEGTPIYALDNSYVRTATMSDTYGNYLILEHDNGICSLYAHCSQLLVQTDDHVSAGQIIAYVGQTGNVTGSHLHLELWRAEKLLNPEDYLDETAYS